MIPTCMQDFFRSVVNTLFHALMQAISNFQHTLKEVDVTISARGGDTGTHGKK